MRLGHLGIKGRQMTDGDHQIGVTSSLGWVGKSVVVTSRFKVRV